MTKGLRKKQKKLLNTIEQYRVLTTDDYLNLANYSSIQSLHVAVMKLIFKGFPIDFVPLEKEGISKSRAIYYLKGEEIETIKCLENELSRGIVDFSIYKVALRKLKKQLEKEPVTLFDKKFSK